MTTTRPKQCCCKCGCEQAPAILFDERPSLKSAIKGLFSPDTWNFCMPWAPLPLNKGNTTRAGRNDAIKPKLGFNNSATTCELSDASESSIEVGDGWDIPGDKFGASVSSIGWRSSTSVGWDLREQPIEQHVPPPSPSQRSRHHVRSATTCSALRRPRLGSSSSLSCKTTDSRHRRSHNNTLPTLDKIWNHPPHVQASSFHASSNQSPPLSTIQLQRPSTIHMRNLSTGTQLTATSFGSTDCREYASDGTTGSVVSIRRKMDPPVEESDIDSDEEEDCFDWSVSEHDDEICSLRINEDDGTSESSTCDNISAQAASKHNRHLSYCSSTSECSHQSARLIAGNLEEEPTIQDPRGVFGPSGSTGAAAKDSIKYHPSSYLPILPMPPSAAVNTMAAVFTAGWAAVFWDFPINNFSKKNDEQVPSVVRDNLFFVQLLSGGVLQLTCANESKSTIRQINPKTVPSPQGSNWKVQQVSRRAGNCLVMEAASSSTSKQVFNRKLYILPVHLPPSSRDKMLTFLDMHSPSKPIEDRLGDAMFCPFSSTTTNGKSASYAPHDQHDAVTYLQFAMDAALALDQSVQKKALL